MNDLSVSIEISGRQVSVGTISGEESSEAVFSYLSSYINSPAAVPISLSLPLKAEAFSARETRNFFEGLLPEGFTRRSVAGYLRADADDYAALLLGLGRECLGAVRITDSAAEPEEASYGKLSLAEVHALAREGASRSAELVTKAHLSLTGASGKVGLYLDSRSGDWYLPKGSAPSTHIVKQSHIRLDGIVTNEQLCMLTAARLGLPVPASFIIDTTPEDPAHDREDGDVLFATERFDRLADDSCGIPAYPEAGLLPERSSSSFDSPATDNSLVRPRRLHQEDFCQALGIPAARKYETSAEGYLARMFALLRQASANPIEDSLRLWDALIFDYLIGNTDNHLKNFSLLYAPDLRSMRLAPFYDIVSTCVYESSTRDMAQYIGGEVSLDRLSRDSFARAAKEAGIGLKPALSRFDRLAGSFRAALHASACELEASGFVLADELEQRILRNGGIAAL